MTKPRRTPMTPLIKSNRFHYTEKTRTFTAEISELFGDLDNYSATGPIRIQSAVTGTVLEFQPDGPPETDREGDITCWKYTNKGLGVHVVIFND